MAALAGAPHRSPAAGPSQDLLPLRRLLLLIPVLVLAAPRRPRQCGAQHRLLPVAEMRGEPALELALRKLDTVGNLMMTTAHPDDENNALLAYYGLTKGFRTSLVTATRGEGGQNEIGPELFEALAVLRTEELLAVHKFDGAEQYFTRAVDFGFSFSVEETLEKWGGQAILGDYVRMIRTIRPDVMVGFVYDGEGGGQHHQASARLSAQAFRAAADPNAFPDQIAAGLRPWQVKKSLLHGALLRRRRAAGAHRRGRDVDVHVHRRRHLRSGARPHLQRDRRRSPQHAQVPGHVAAAAAARRQPGLRLGSAGLPAARHGAARRREPSRPRDVRRRGDGAVEPGRLRRRGAAGRAGGRLDANRVERRRRPRRRGRQGLDRRRGAAGRRIEGGPGAACRPRHPRTERRRTL